MKIDHVAIYVCDLEAAKEFFVHFFGGSSNSMYHNPRTGLKTYFITFDDGGRLEIMQRPNLNPAILSIHQGYTHIAFSVGSKSKVDFLTRELADSGYEVLSDPRITGDGYYESCVLGFENNLIEITE